MKRALIITGIVLSMVFHISCNTDFLNTEPLDKIASNAVWSDGPLSEAFVFNIYSSLGYGGFEEEALATMTDEAMFTHGRNIRAWNEGSVTASNLGNTRVTPQWGELYSAIRKANVALENLETATFDDPPLLERLKGESHFLRAYYYHQLVRYYGGVPKIDKAYGLGEDYSIARSSYEEIVNFMVSDLDAAAQLLEGKDDGQRGRATELSAMALKARILLYAASDLHDGPTASANSSLIGGYSNLEYIAYTSGDRNARWTAARDAALAVLAENPGYKLDLMAPVTPEEGEANYVAIAMGGGSAAADAGAAVELLWERTHTPLYTVEDGWPLGGIHYGINNGPNGYHNWAGNTPIQEMVDDYEFMDGTKFDWTNPAHAAAPYTNRDPRFYASVLYDGADWKPRPSDVASIDPVNQVQTGYYGDGSGGIINGVDTRKSPIEDWNGTRTHYYTRKFIDPDPALPDNQSNAQVIPWPFIRVTEMAFIVAEAALELEDEPLCRSWLNKIRFRAGMPAITDSGDDLKNRLMNERRVELAYEEHRYFDARRWMVAPETLGRKINIIDVKAEVKAGASPHVPYKYDPAVYDYTYTPVEYTEEVRTWVDKMYYRPISRDEMNKNLLLVNNPGYAEE